MYNRTMSNAHPSQEIIDSWDSVEKEARQQSTQFKSDIDTLIAQGLGLTPVPPKRKFITAYEKSWLYRIQIKILDKLLLWARD